MTTSAKRPGKKKPAADTPAPPDQQDPTATLDEPRLRADDEPRLRDQGDLPDSDTGAIFGAEPVAAQQRDTRYGFGDRDDQPIDSAWEHLPREYWPADRLTPAPYNGDVREMTDEEFQELKRGIREFGLVGGLDARVEDGLMIGGHHRLRAATELIEEFKWEPDVLRRLNLPDGKIPVNPIRGMPDATAALLNVRLNNPKAQGRFKTAGLAQLLSDLDAHGFDASLSGFTGDELEDLLTFEPEPALNQEEEREPPPPPATPRSAPGDLYLLGRSRLLCGSATEPADWERLMGGKKADGLFTDPPYGIGYVGKTEDALTIQNDDLDEGALDTFLDTSFGLALAHMKAGGSVYCFAPGGPLFEVFGRVLKRHGVWRQTISWIKDRFVLSRQDYHWRDEPALIGEKPGDRPKGKPSKALIDEAATLRLPIVYGWRDGARHYFIDDRTQDNIWTVDRPARNADHPTMKPTELYRRGYRNSSKPGSIWLEPFAGSGTAYIAGDQTSRAIYGMELDPRYVDVIVKRWEQHTGQRARRFTAGHAPADDPQPTGTSAEPPTFSV